LLVGVIQPCKDLIKRNSDNSSVREVIMKYLQVAYMPYIPSREFPFGKLHLLPYQTRGNDVLTKLSLVFLTLCRKV